MLCEDKPKQEHAKITSLIDRSLLSQVAYDIFYFAERKQSIAEFQGRHFFQTDVYIPLKISIPLSKLFLKLRFLVEEIVFRKVVLPVLY